MKKIFIAIFSILLSLRSFAEGDYVDTTYFFNIEYDYLVRIHMFYKNYYLDVCCDRREFDLIKAPSINACYDPRLKIDNHFVKGEAKLGDTHECFYYILGKGLLIPVEKYFPYDLNTEKLSDKPVILVDIAMRKNKLDPSSYSYQNWKKYKEYAKFDSKNLNKSNWHEWSRKIIFYDAGIKNITASSYLSENTKNGYMEYLPQNFLERLYYMTGDDYDRISYDTVTPPWAEGKDDYGIGEYLDIEFKWSSDELQILNGFVDFTRMDLYEKNSRVKTVLIESENPKFSKEYQLEDLVRYTLITLPQKTQKIRMTIKDVYPGTKYKDTCLSSILVTNPNVPSYEEMKEKILNAIKKGVIDRRYDKSEPLPDFIKVEEK